MLIVFVATKTYAENVKNIPFQTLATLPHNKDYFTQGLVYKAPYLYESTGLYKKSHLVKYRFENGRLSVLSEKRLPANIFAEGLTLYDDKLYLLTYKKQKLMVFEPSSLELLEESEYKGEGWGLHYAANKFFMTSGSDLVYIRSKNDFSVSHELPLTYAGKRLKHVNELDWAKGYLLGNIWYDTKIVFINPFSGKVRAYIDLKGLMQKHKIQANNVANGIAYDNENNILFVTGKNWPFMFLISPNLSEL